MLFQNLGELNQDLFRHLELLGKFFDRLHPLELGDDLDCRSGKGDLFFVETLRIDENRDRRSVFRVLGHLRDETAHMRGLDVRLGRVVMGKGLVWGFIVGHDQMIQRPNRGIYHRKV